MMPCTGSPINLAPGDLFVSLLLRQPSADSFDKGREMTKTKRKMIEGWIDKASNQLQAAKEHSKYSYRYSEAIEAAQECIELSVKSILSLLGVKFPPSHGWEQDKKQFAEIAAQIQEKQLIERLATQYLNHFVSLPRLLFLVNFWAQFYVTAKYGFEAGHLASAQDLFKKEEADLAAQHAQECYQAASYLRYLDEGKWNVLISSHKNHAE
jgi:HEPN domain-containing protein